MRNRLQGRASRLILHRMRVIIYSKAGCTLCIEAKEALERVKARVPFVLSEVDITSDPALFAAHRYDIPVVFIDGHKAFKHRLDEALFEARLRRALSGTPVAQPGDQDGEIPPLEQEK